MVAIGCVAKAALQRVAYDARLWPRARAVHPEPRRAPRHLFHQLPLRHPRLHDGKSHLRIDLADGVHLGKVHQHTARRGGGGVAIAPVLSPADGIERHAMRACRHREALHLRHGLWPHHTHGRMAAGQRGASVARKGAGGGIQRQRRDSLGKAGDIGILCHGCKV
jgi:hypothetical protein